ncbi:IS1/IS1595 family N-terminal zinc-binding domain-containing protein [Enterococcus hirae]|uniref:IS1/IS1595 family N-terminal zinc-binding domain-containing protein n=1 Tax=Enterococcus hirae TaxID=1354 RepID=UPI0035621E12
MTKILVFEITLLIIKLKGGIVMLCNRCGSETIKYGTHNGEQVYQCKSCGHVLTKRSKNNESLKQEINELLASGKARDMDDIAKHYGVSKRTVQRWVSK